MSKKRTPEERVEHNFKYNYSGPMSEEEYKAAAQAETDPRGIPVVNLDNTDEESDK